MAHSSAVWKTLIVNLVLGGLMVLAFEPFGLWLFAPLSLAAFFALITRATGKHTFLSGLAFGYGLYGFGVSWVYVSLSTYGGMPLWMGIIAVLGFAGILALFIGLMAYSVSRLFSGNIKSQLFALPLAWVIFEWMKSWVLTGFPWLDIGYTQTSTWLLGWAPIGGIYLVSLAVGIASGSLAWCIVFKRTHALTVLPVLVLVSWAVDTFEWSQDQGLPLQVGIVQANVPINSKWAATERDRLIGRYVSLSSELSASQTMDLIVWPETALPLYRQSINPAFWQSITPPGTALLTGLLDAPSLAASPPSYDQTYNAAVLVCDGDTQTYRKRHLVPFGEYMPLRFVFGWVLDYLQLPMSDLAYWQGVQPLRCQGKIDIGLSICYEDAFANEYRQNVGDASLLVNISEDAWFGDSFAPHQRLQMAQMRARELARPMVRSANSGPSVFLDERGRVLAKTEQFTVQTLSHQIQPKTGDTLYKRFGNWVILFSILIIAILAWQYRSSDPAKTASGQADK